MNTENTIISPIGANASLLPESSPLSIKLAIKQAIGSTTPYSASIIAIMAGDFIANYLLSRLGLIYLAGSGLIAISEMFIFVTSSAFFNATGILVSQAKANQQTTRASQLFKSSLLLALAIGIPCLLYAVFSQPILIACQQPPQSAEIAGKYFRYFAAGIPFVLANMVCQQFALGVGKPGLTLISAVFNTALMLAIGAGLMQGAGWHAEGIGLAKTVAAVITFSAFMAYYALHPFFKSYQILQWQKPEFSKIFALGGPIALQVLSETGSALGLSSLLGLLGDAALAAQQAAIQWYSIASAPLLCIAQVAGTQVTQANEQQNINSARLYGNVNLGIGLGWSLLCTALFCSMPKYLLSVFIDSADPNNANIMQTASWLMVINALGLIVDGLRNIASGALRGFHDTKTALAVGIISTCLLTLPLAYALEFPAKLNESGVYIARDVGFAAGSAMMLYHWHKKSKQSATVMPLSPTP